ncbi:hypothetical protein QJS04_geneDACA011802 [Acorus gramineus]|uniref:Uncharacterized protein n=1 Tax=Acorus gramineus TaxID=55184 RepID=A0AAV9BF74_ACOGR|nr:hypothetical protein QJS04_geneDACA011802 [Acorus gramineus]
MNKQVKSTSINSDHFLNDVQAVEWKFLSIDQGFEGFRKEENNQLTIHKRKNLHAWFDKIV